VLQATGSEGLTPGPYVAVRVGFEPVTSRTQGTEHAKVLQATGSEGLAQ